MMHPSRRPGPAGLLGAVFGFTAISVIPNTALIRACEIYMGVILPVLTQDG
jgi:hypothetical protein